MVTDEASGPGRRGTSTDAQWSSGNPTPQNTGRESYHTCDGRGSQAGEWDRVWRRPSTALHCTALRGSESSRVVWHWLQVETFVQIQQSIAQTAAVM